MRVVDDSDDTPHTLSMQILKRTCTFFRQGSGFRLNQIFIPLGGLTECQPSLGIYLVAISMQVRPCIRNPRRDIDPASSTLGEGFDRLAEARECVRSLSSRCESENGAQKDGTINSRCRANMTHQRQSGSDFGLGTYKIVKARFGPRHM